MRCPTCGADNSESAAFCQLCLTRIDELPTARPRAAAATASWGGQMMLEHQWWVRRRAEYVESLEKGLPTSGGTYALAAYDGQVRYRRALWWSATVFVAFAWLATMRLTAFEWTFAGMANRSGLAATVLQAVLILVVGAAAACVCAAWVSGPDAWRATLVSVFFWSLLAVLLAIAAVVGGVYGLSVVSAIALGLVLFTAVVPLSPALSHAVPRRPSR